MNNFEHSIESLIKSKTIKELNAMQSATVDAFVENKNLLLLSPTGSGKTLAYLLAIANLLQANKEVNVIIIAPSRELALQIETVYKAMLLPFKISCCYGGHKREIEERSLLETPALLVGTPGRIADHIRRGNVQLKNVQAIILDEFDKLLELNFNEEMAFIFEHANKEAARFLTSATELKELPSFTNIDKVKELNYLQEQDKIRITNHYIKCKNKDKVQDAFDLLCSFGDKPSILFCNHRDAVERVSGMLNDLGLETIFYHGALMQDERETAIAKFKNGSSYILVTTDLAARGLDIAYVRNIIHYHLPQTNDIYTHRNGRTARMDASGQSILMIGTDEHLPDYADAQIEEYTYKPTQELPPAPAFKSVFINTGKKNKVNKIDVVGFLTQQANLKMDDIGLIDVKDFSIIVAIRATRIREMMQRSKDRRLKNKRVLFSLV
jgi:superfamily II DNA/RNA helicase